MRLPGRLRDADHPRPQACGFGALGCVGNARRLADDPRRSGYREPLPSNEKLTGEIVIDGSGTVAPIATAVAEKFSEIQPGVRVPVGTAGTGGGYKSSSKGRPRSATPPGRSPSRKRPSAREKGIEYLELKVGIDGLSVVVNPANDWCKAITTEQLKKRCGRPAHRQEVE